MLNHCARKGGRIWLGPVCLFLLSTSLLKAAPATNYVSVDGTNFTAPFNSWSLATTNIQDAVSACSSGDVVVVSNGTYYITNQIAITNIITLLSLHGASSTIVVRAASGTNAPQHRIFQIMTNALLDGFTVKNGYLPADSRGAGIYMLKGTVQNCVVYTNWLGQGWSSFGAGVYMAAGTLQLCTLVSNHSSAWGYGGGVCQDGGLVHSNTIFYNGALAGGGISTYAGVVQHCTIEYNFAPGYIGGGIGAHGNYPSPVISNCLIRFNVAYQGGGFGMPGVGLLIDCTIVSNTATLNGGGIYASMNYNNLNFKRCVIAGNSNNDSAALFLAGGNATAYGSYNFESCLVADNAGARSIRLTGGPNWSRFRNCTIAASQPYGVIIDGPFYTNYYSKEQFAYPLFQNTIIYNFSTNIHSTNALTLATVLTNASFTNSCSPQLVEQGFNNITNDPVFMVPSAGNYRLAENSPCINAGYNWITNALDLDRGPRMRYMAIDIGAYERVFNATLYYFR